MVQTAVQGAKANSGGLSIWQTKIKLGSQADRVCPLREGEKRRFRLSRFLTAYLIYCLFLVLVWPFISAGLFIRITTMAKAYSKIAEMIQTTTARQPRIPKRIWRRELTR